MFSKKRSQGGRLDDIAETLTRIEAALPTTSPANGPSAEAYEGLRRAIIATGRDRRRHLAHLVAMAEAIERGTSTADLAVLVEHWCREEGLEKSSDPSRPELFQITSEEGDIMKVLSPAWVDTSGEGSPALVKRGVAAYEPTDRPTSEAGQQ